MTDEISASADENLAVRYHMEQLTFRQDGKSLGYCRRQFGDWSDPKKKAAVVLLFHGAGERGDNNWSQLVWGAKEITAYCEKTGIKALFLAPQCPAEKQWVDTPWDLTEHTMPAESESMKLAMAMLDSELARPGIDLDRVYVTGISMGGYGTWDAISRRPEKFAAAFPVCGGVDVAQVGKFRHMPILIYHGDSDTTVPTVRSRNAAAALKAAGAENFRYVEVPNTGHDSWHAAYGNEANIAWLFAQKRK